MSERLPEVPEPKSFKAERTDIVGDLKGRVSDSELAHSMAIATDEIQTERAELSSAIDEAYENGSDRKANKLFDKYQELGESAEQAEDTAMLDHFVEEYGEEDGQAEYERAKLEQEFIKAHKDLERALGEVRGLEESLQRIQADIAKDEELIRSSGFFGRVKARSSIRDAKQEQKWVGKEKAGADERRAEAANRLDEVSQKLGARAAKSLESVK